MDCVRVFVACLLQVSCTCVTVDAVLVLRGTKFIKLTTVPCGNSRVIKSMGNLTVAVLGAAECANSLGKKGTASDITLYNLKKGEDTVTFIEPTRYPERLAPLFYAVAMANKAIVVVDDLNSTFGECLVMLQCAGVTSGYFVLRNYIAQEKIIPLLNGTSLEKFKFIEDNPALLKERCLIEAAQKANCETEDATGTVPVDHAFSEKGVGTVVLGLVAKGTIKKTRYIEDSSRNKDGSIAVDTKA